MVQRDNVTHRGQGANDGCVRPLRPRTDSARISSSHRGGSDARHKTRNRSRAHRIIEALAIVLHNADGASFLVWPRYGRNERTSSAITLICVGRSTFGSKLACAHGKVESRDWMPTYGSSL